MVHAFRLQPSALAVLAPCHTLVVAEATLRAVEVPAESERADGPVQGYNAKRSSTFTKTDTPLREVPASITVVPRDLMKDQAMRGMDDVLRYVPGVTVHQG